MKNPPHPGHSIKDACLDPLGLSVTDGAKVLGVARHTLSRVINGQAGISPEMAIRLEKAGWSNADHWLRLQVAFDLAQARQHAGAIRVRRYEPDERSVR
jgi:addiction module HigA family antidote